MATVLILLMYGTCVKKPLYRHSRSYMEQQQTPLKLRVGVEFTVFRPKNWSVFDHVDFFI